MTKQKDAGERDPGKSQLEILKTGQDKAQVIVPALNNFPVLIPSPSGKQVAVWASVKDWNQPEKLRLFVVNDQGTVTARIELGHWRG